MYAGCNRRAGNCGLRPLRLRLRPGIEGGGGRGGSHCDLVCSHIRWAHRVRRLGGHVAQRPQTKPGGNRGGSAASFADNLFAKTRPSLPRFEPINSPQLFSEDRDGVGVPSITPILTLFCSVKRHSSPGTHSYAQLLCLVLSQQSRPAFVPPSECRVEIEIECRVSLELRSSLHAVCSERRCSDLCCSCPQ